jgi:hypothetical protein
MDSQKKNLNVNLVFLFIRVQLMVKEHQILKLYMKKLLELKKD